MRALQYDEFGGRIRVVERPDPVAPHGGAVIRVARTGLCRSDFHGWRGHDSDTVLPCVPGHEFTGTVIEAPEDPALLGRRVIVPFVLACGSCPECTAGAAQVCRAQRQPGFTDPGSFAEALAIPQARVNSVPLPDAIDDDTAAALGCRVATSWRALIGVGALLPGERVLILGAGGVGLAAVQIALGIGAQPIAADISRAALALAESLGAQPLNLSGDESAEEIAARAREICGDGVDLSLDALGAPALAAGGVLALRRGGRHVQVGLLDQPRTELPLARIIAHELRVLGSHGMAAADYPALLTAIAEGRLDPGALVSDVLGLAAGADALMSMGDAGTARGIRLIDPAR